MGQDMPLACHFPPLESGLRDVAFKNRHPAWAATCGAERHITTGATGLSGDTSTGDAIASIVIRRPSSASRSLRRHLNSRSLWSGRSARFFLKSAPIPSEPPAPEAPHSAGGEARAARHSHSRSARWIIFRALGVDSFGTAALAGRCCERSHCRISGLTGIRTCIGFSQRIRIGDDHRARRRSFSQGRQPSSPERWHRRLRAKLKATTELPVEWIPSAITVIVQVWSYVPIVGAVIGVAAVMGVAIAVPIVGRNKRAADDRTAEESGPKAPTESPAPHHLNVGSARIFDRQWLDIRHGRCGIRNNSNARRRHSGREPQHSLEH
jgi:hypothetical protein